MAHSNNLYRETGCASTILRSTSGISIVSVLIACACTALLVGFASTFLVQSTSQLKTEANKVDTDSQKFTLISTLLEHYQQHWLGNCTPYPCYPKVFDASGNLQGPTPAQGTTLELIPVAGQKIDYQTVCKPWNAGFHGSLSQSTLQDMSQKITNLCPAINCASTQSIPFVQISFTGSSASQILFPSANPNGIREPILAAGMCFQWETDNSIEYTHAQLITATQNSAGQIQLSSQSVNLGDEGAFGFGNPTGPGL